MNKRYGFSLLALMAGLIAVVGLAQEGRGPGGRGGRDMMRMMPVMAALDADGDGVISADEINNASVALRKLDKNGDGKLTEDEIRPNFPQGGPGGRGFGGPGGPGGFGGPNPDEMVKLNTRGESCPGTTQCLDLAVRFWGRLLLCVDPYKS